jgi:hypothetical protein
LLCGRSVAPHPRVRLRRARGEAGGMRCSIAR